MTMTKYLCIQFNEKCAVCPMKISFITRFCKHHLGCTIPRYVNRKTHDYTEDLKLSNEVINKLAMLSDSCEIRDYNNYELVTNLSNEQKEYVLKVLI